ncbi:hypothetical protein KFU94_09725 [Chloroflexi bacterium TSY]|nr:hypothetical protein [Chloroflexi bacterium TSY]
MNLLIVHVGLARTATYFLAVLAIWAIFLRIRKQPLDGNWYGAAVIGELLLIGQFLLGWFLYFQFGSGALARPFLHILYGVVAVITLPAGYSYFGGIEDEGVQTIAMAVVCIFLWGIVQRSGTVATYLPF